MQNNHKGNLSIAERVKIIKAISSGASQKSQAELYGLTASAISQIMKKKSNTLESFQKIENQDET